MINYTTSETDQEFAEIIDLQKENLPQNLTKSEMRQQGFVTVSHSMDDLRKMNKYEHNLVIKDDNKIEGYILAMTKKSKLDIPILIPMFNNLDKIQYKEKLVSAFNYIVVGQVCIHKDYRGQGLFDKGYDAYKNHFKDKYDFVITSIAKTNMRSMNAHKRIGFVELHSFFDLQNVEWSIVAWDWQ